MRPAPGLAARDRAHPEPLFSQQRGFFFQHPHRGQLSATVRMVFNSLLLWTLATVSVEWARHRELSWRGYLQAAKIVLANPVVACLLLGPRWGPSGFPPP